MAKSVADQEAHLKSIITKMLVDKHAYVCEQENKQKISVSNPLGDKMMKETMLAWSLMGDTAPEVTLGEITKMDDSEIVMEEKEVKKAKPKAKSFYNPRVYLLVNENSSSYTGTRHERLAVFDKHVMSFQQFVDTRQYVPEQIHIVGGETMMYTKSLIRLIDKLNFLYPSSSIRLHTGQMDNLNAFLKIMPKIYYVHFHVHDIRAIRYFVTLDRFLKSMNQFVSTPKLVLHNSVTQWKPRPTLPKHKISILFDCDEHDLEDGDCIRLTDGLTSGCNYAKVKSKAKKKKFNDRYIPTDDDRKPMIENEW